jgi:exodeoxyribonuclease VII large subunit
VSPHKPPSGRPPFDPKRARATASPPPASLTVSQLTRLVKEAVCSSLPSTVHVVGELSNVSQPPGGHIYFTLKDASSEVRCVMWRSDARGLRFDLDDGLEVLASGSIDVYEPRGQYQLYVKRLEPRGVGALELAFRQLRDRLHAEGLFDPAHKRAIPRYPQRVALVTSASGAALQDILRTLGRRFGKLHVFVVDVRVQGSGAAAEIADAIRRLNRCTERLGGIDVIIAGRGGGSLEDLWAFNEEIVARAIHASEIPIVSAVGHEVDFTIADFTADLRAATPTAAAEIVAPVLTELMDDLLDAGRRLTAGVTRRLEQARSRLDLVERSAWFRDPAGQIQRRKQPIDEVTTCLRHALSRTLAARRSAIGALETRLARARPAVQLAQRRERLARMAQRLHSAVGRFALDAERRLSRRQSRLLAASPRRCAERHRIVLDEWERGLWRDMIRALSARAAGLDAIVARLAASSHEKVLSRGFTITRLAKGIRWLPGPIVHTADEVREGDRLVTQTADGEIASRVADRRQGELFET